MPRTTHLLPEAANDPVGPDSIVESCTVRLPPGCDPFANLEPAPSAQACMPYAEAQRLMAIARTHGDAALTPEQHDAIWDCLLAQPESHAWLNTQLDALSGELQQRGLIPCPPDDMAA